MNKDEFRAAIQKILDSEHEIEQLELSNKNKRLKKEIVLYNDADRIRPMIIFY